MVRRFRRKNSVFFSFFFLDESIAGTPRHVCKTFHANVRSLDCVRRANVKSYLRPKADLMLKLSSYKATTQNYTFSARKSKCPRRLLEIDPDCLDPCSVSPCQAGYQWGGGSWFFSAGKIGSPETQVSQIYIYI